MRKCKRLCACEGQLHPFTLSTCPSCFLFAQANYTKMLHATDRARVLTSTDKKGFPCKKKRGTSLPFCSPATCRALLECARDLFIYSLAQPREVANKSEGVETIKPASNRSGLHFWTSGLHLSADASIIKFKTAGKAK